MKKAFLIPIPSSAFQSHVNETYESFLELARRLSKTQTESLTDTDDIAQLQDLYYLVKEGALKISEEHVSGGRHYFLLELNRPSHSLTAPESPSLPAVFPEPSRGD